MLQVLLCMSIEDVLSFWFANKTRWWKKDPAFDDQIRKRFAPLLSSIANKEHEEWKATPRGTLAYVIVLDQFSRNMFRDTPGMFSNDEQALETAKEAIDKGFDQQLSHEERGFLYMPLMHSEVLTDQERCVQLFDTLGNADSLDYAIRHRDIIKRFGRFPHRNGMLGRSSTAEEVEFLKQPGSSF